MDRDQDKARLINTSPLQSSSPKFVAVVFLDLMYDLLILILNGNYGVALFF